MVAAAASAANAGGRVADIEPTQVAGLILVLSLMARYRAAAMRHRAGWRDLRQGRIFIDNHCQLFKYNHAEHASSHAVDTRSGAV